MINKLISICRGFAKCDTVALFIFSLVDINFRRVDISLWFRCRAPVVGRTPNRFASPAVSPALDLSACISGAGRSSGFCAGRSGRTFWQAPVPPP